ncbi:putative rhamnosyl transferase [Ruegeria sp. 2012CJ41-6]|uniref:Rhamnosyl transferase n=2 Tax=Ruegeria spongiae TaxID=2942209 RepID=A0ABT0Q6J5_9RHOB|nr:putative rhamnosyl transferase [Ruegeria spongiae]
MRQVQIVSHPPGKHRGVMQNILNAARMDPSQPWLQFRHDDDAAVSVDFIERLRSAVEEYDGLVRGNLTVAFDYNRGFVEALGLYIAGKCKATLMNFAHWKIDRVMPTVSNTDQPMWVRTHRGCNESRQKPVKPVPVTPLSPEQEVEFSMRFAIDSDRVRQVFGCV